MDDEAVRYDVDNVQSRILSLEKKTQLQDDEIVCLKSALADALRRLNALEMVQKSGAVNYKPLIKSSTPSPSPRNQVTQSNVNTSGRDGMQTSLRHSTLSLSTNAATTPTKPQPTAGASQRGPQTASPSNAVTTRKRPSLGDSNGSNSPVFSPTENESLLLHPLLNAANRQVSGSVGSLSSSSTAAGYQKLPLTPQSSTPRQKDNVYNAADGCLRFFLRGRALNFYAPTNLAADVQVSAQSQPPKEKLALEWVGEKRQSIAEMLHLIIMKLWRAAVVVLYNVDEQMQRHYLGHNDDVKCMAVHPDKVTIATGQVAGHDKSEGKAHVRIWNSISLNTLKVIGLGAFDRAVACLTFSKVDGGQILVAVDESNEHILSVWDWQKGEKGHKITEAKSSTEPILAVEFHPCDASMFTTCGKSQISFWLLESGSVSRKQGIFDKYEKAKFITCLAFAENGDILSGDSNGTVLVWTRGTNKISQAVTGAHDGGVFSICLMKDGSLVTGGKDRKLVQWTNSYKKTGQEVELSEAQGAVRMISQGKGNLLLVGTTRNVILQGSFELKFSPIVQGHVEELWGVAVCPNQNQFVTVGHDKLLYLWDALTHNTIWSKELPLGSSDELVTFTTTEKLLGQTVSLMEISCDELKLVCGVQTERNRYVYSLHVSGFTVVLFGNVQDGGHSITVHPEGQLLVASSAMTPRWFVIDVTSREVIETHSDATERIECMEYSPDAKQLACGSRDNNIYVYTVSDGGRKYSKTCKLTGHSSFVTHLDWSTDGLYIQSNSGDYELLYWSTANWRQITSSSQLRDVEWFTQNCTLAFSVCGIWPEGADGTDINGCCRSVRHHLLATADDFGKVNLFAYPCYSPRSAARSYRGHSSHVTSVRFLCDDSRLLSLGGKDSAVLQWQVIDSTF